MNVVLYSARKETDLDNLVLILGTEISALILVAIFLFFLWRIGKLSSYLENASTLLWIFFSFVAMVLVPLETIKIAQGDTGFHIPLLLTASAVGLTHLIGCKLYWIKRLKKA